jgi:hypothetical protein
MRRNALRLRPEGSPLGGLRRVDAATGRPMQGGASAVMPALPSHYRPAIPSGTVDSSRRTWGCPDDDATHSSVGRRALCAYSKRQRYDAIPVRTSDDCGDGKLGRTDSSRLLREAGSEQWPDHGQTARQAAPVHTGLSAPGLRELRSQAHGPCLRRRHRDAEASEWVGTTAGSAAQLGSVQRPYGKCTLTPVFLANRQDGR